MAVLVDENATIVNVALSDLPCTVKCGDVLRLIDGVYRIDSEETESRRSYVLALQEKLRKKK